jgi:hypothetical protein
VAGLDYAKAVELEIHPTQEPNRSIVVDDEHRHAAEPPSSNSTQLTRNQLAVSFVSCL